MAHSRKKWVDKNHQAYRWYRHWIFSLGLIIVFLVSILMFTACEEVAKLIVSNKMPTDVVIIHESIDTEGKVFLEEEIGMAPAKQTKEMTYALVLRRGIIGDTVLLKAKDPAGNIVWQKSWSFNEFYKLKEVSWKIVVSPETGS